MRPSRMLAHRGSDGDTFCDHESYWVYSHVGLSGLYVDTRLVEGRGDIVFASVTGHDAQGIVLYACLQGVVWLVAKVSFLGWG